MLPLGLALSLAYIPGITGNVLQTGWAVLSLTLPLLLWVPTRAITVFHWAGAAFLTYAVISAQWSSNTWDSIFRLWQFAILAFAFHLGTLPVNLPSLWKGLAIGVGISSAVACLQWFGYTPLPHYTPYPGIYYNGVASGAITAITIIALLSSGLWRWALPLIPGLILSGSRSAIFCAAFGLLLTFHRRAWTILIPLLAALAVTLSIGPSDIQRYAIWSTTFRLLDFFGQGAGAFLTMVLSFNGTIAHVEYAHNDFLQLVFEFGIGCLPLLVFGFPYAQHHHPQFPVISVFALLALVSMPLHIPVVAFVFAVASGRLVRDYVTAWESSNLQRLYLPNESDTRRHPLPAQLGLPQ